MPVNTTYSEQCPFCSDKHFVGRRALEEHWTNSQRHGWCQMCEKLFQDRIALATHMRAVHMPQTQSKNAVGPKPHKDPTDAPQRQAAEGGTSWYIDSRPGHDVCHDKAAHRPQTPTPQNLVCFGCDREFYSYASMILHLEEGECITTMAELARIAESASYSDRYIVYGWREYLRTEYGLEKTAFDTDNETVWECVECRKVFYTLSKASVHARSAAHKPRLFKCPSCPKDFNALSGLLQHVEQSNSCPEGLYKGTRVMGRLLSEIGDRMVEKDNHKLEPESSSASMAPAE